MEIIKIINEVIREMVSPQGKVWYHGTPDINDMGSDTIFEPRNSTIEIIANPEKWNEAQQGMESARENKDDDSYWKWLDVAGKQRGRIKYMKPTFFSDNSSVANSYADDSRAYDYQNAEAKLIKANINDSGKILTIQAHGKKFSDIGVDLVRQSLTNDGNSDEDINRVFNMFDYKFTRHNTLKTDDIAAITQQLDYDIIDIVGIYDSHAYGNIKSTVRMVFDPSRINVIN